jgi:hypothetical protein
MLLILITTLEDDELMMQIGYGKLIVVIETKPISITKTISKRRKKLKVNILKCLLLCKDA